MGRMVVVVEGPRGKSPEKPPKKGKCCGTMVLFPVKIHYLYWFN